MVAAPPLISKIFISCFATTQFLAPLSASFSPTNHPITSLPSRPNNNLNIIYSKLFSATSSDANWKDMTVPQLKSFLKNSNLPVSGRKDELIERLEEHDHNLKAAAYPQSFDKKKSISFPPPKDDTEVEVMEKEVQETVRMLEGLKLGSSKKSISTSQQRVPSKETLTQQQIQQKKLMNELKQSLYKSQNQKPQQSRQPLAEIGSEQMQHYLKQLRLKPANDLKVELSNLRLSTKGRKPDLVGRLAKYYVAQDRGESDVNADGGMDEEDVNIPAISAPSSHPSNLNPMSFAGIFRLSTVATNALLQAFGDETLSIPEPTPIQRVAIPKLFYAQQSALLHAPTGSGKTLTYILPITESLWKEVDDAKNGDDVDPDEMENGIALILLPTRELAAQVAGVASVLAPPGMVKLVPRPMNLMSCWKTEADRGEEYEYYQNEEDEGPTNTSGRTSKPRIFVGSAKSISISFFGDNKMPAPPTSKPEGKSLLACVRWLVLDEVDRLLNVKKTRTDKTFKRHEKPAAMLAAATARLTKGRVQVIAASATVGRPLRRELSRVLGLHSSECPETLRGEDDKINIERKLESDEKHIGRAVTIPDTVKNYVLPVDGSTTGSLLTSAAFAAKAILSPPQQHMASRKVLLVLTRGCDIKVHNALGALRHFGIKPEPQSLLDALEADGTDRLMEAHRKVSRVVGVGGSKEKNSKLHSDDGYLLVTHEDNVRGLHLDGLDAVIVCGRPGSPDEYTHIAGRTGRAGRVGSVLNIVSYEQASALASWAKMLGVDFLPVDESELKRICVAETAR